MPDSRQPAPEPGRRRLLTLAGTATALAYGAGLAPALAHLAGELPADLWRRPRALWVTRPQCQEAVRETYWAQSRVQGAGYAALNHIYRDVIAGRTHPIALGLLDLNFVLQLAVARVAGPRPLVLLSGYRTTGTNAAVGGTEPNLHGLGLADDFIYEGLSLAQNFRLAQALQVGGLGLYPERGSLHKDIGPRRSWITHGRAGPRRH